ncbi:MAG: ribonuclease E/G, partial [Alphaproteobacteria bacterium]|nr:ribonuclease E/G [Alphaproteobacteria bacterium]
MPIADREALLNEERTLAAAQAEREDEEDAAEIAAADESIKDEEIPKDENLHEEEGKEDNSEEASASTATATATEDDEKDISKSTNSIASEIGQEVIIDTLSETEKEENGKDDSLLETEEGISPVPIVATGDDLPENTEEGKDPDVEIIGGDVIDAPLYRSSIKRRYKIQEVIKRNQIMLIQISKEERGNKGAAVTTYISLPGRYCVLMPNSPRGGGVSRKVSNAKDRQRLKKILHELNVPEGMSVILRTAGVSRSAVEIKRDLDYLLRLWDQIREFTL